MVDTSQDAIPRYTSGRRKVEAWKQAYDTRGESCGGGHLAGCLVVAGDDMDRVNRDILDLSISCE